MSTIVMSFSSNDLSDKPLGVTATKSLSFFLNFMLIFPDFPGTRPLSYRYFDVNTIFLIISFLCIFNPPELIDLYIEI